MRICRRREPRGTVLMISVLLLTLLAILGMGMLSSSLNENTIARNDINSQRALAVAEAGLAHGRKFISTNLAGTPLSSRLAGATTTAPEVALASVTNVSSLGAGNGTYSVWVSNNLAPYAKSPGYPADAAAATDGDKIIWIRSVGIFRNASRSVRALVNFATILVPPGAVTLIDGSNPTELTANFTGNAFGITGNDTPAPTATGACGTPGPPKRGISVNSTDSLNVITNGLSTNQKDNVTGEGGTSSYANNGDITTSALSAVANTLKAAATPIAGENVSDSFGTAANPGVFVADHNLKLSGNGKGYGILIVTETLELVGNYKWEGLILVVGKGDIRITGADSKLFGAVLVANNRPNGTTNMEIAGNGGAFFSSQAICRVQNMVPSSAIIAWEQQG